MSLQEALKNRIALEEKNQLKHDTRFDDRVRRESHTCLLLIAVISAALYAVGINYYYKYQTKAHASEILAKSEMTTREVRQLNIAKAPSEKAHGTR